MPEKWNRTPNTVCEVCGKPCYKSPYRLKVQKHITCSKACDSIARSKWMKGEGNHQYGLKGELNASYIGKTEKIKSGYKFVRVDNHPFSEAQGWIREHRLIAEQYLLNDENSIEINGHKYLKPEYEVHHIDENKFNNNPNNLMVLTPSEHMHLHNMQKIKFMERDKQTGRFVKNNYQQNL